MSISWLITQMRHADLPLGLMSYPTETGFLHMHSGALQLLRLQILQFALTNGIPLDLQLCRVSHASLGHRVTMS